ncbi:MAG TPA: ATP-grasp domain-containing protein, partial [Thermoanaerobaculia bacterium]|nr:ATP-grasp domain-containing protein [Thermoanaerobaculia bacterium]
SADRGPGAGARAAMRSPEHFIFVESNTTGTGALAVRRLLERGDRVTFLAREPDKYPFLADPSPRLALIPLETNEIETVAARVEELRQEQGLDALLTFSEFYVPVVAEVARRMGTRYLSPEAARTCRGKPATRAALRAAGRSTPKFRVMASAEDARRAAAEISFPCVVKPPADSSSKGVLRVDGPEMLLEHFRRLHAWRVNDRGQELSGEVLLESLLTGPEVSVETVTLAHGETIVVGITAKHLSPPPLFVEVGHDFPALLAADEAARVEAEVRAALDAVGFDFGPAHTEVRLTPQGPVIVEINPRLAGGMIPELVRHATGIDLLEVFLEMLRGRLVDLTPVRADHAAIRFLLADQVGRLRGISGLEEARNLEAVREVWIGKRQGAAVRPAEEAADRVGYVIASGPSRPRVLGAVAGALEKIHLEIDPLEIDRLERERREF